jgi:hypothetical protein
MQLLYKSCSLRFPLPHFQVTFTLGISVLQNLIIIMRLQQWVKILMQLLFINPVHLAFLSPTFR